MELIKHTEFNGVALDCYRENGITGDFWVTREQIGRALEYSEPELSVANIHNRHSERLEKFSTLTKLIRVEGTREISREVTIYNFKGLLEICRYSNQPKANAVMDFLWNIADEIRRTGSYSGKKQNKELTGGLTESAKIIFEAAGIKGNQLALALDKFHKSYTGHSALQAGEIELAAPENKQLLTPTEIGQQLGITPRRVNEILAGAGYQYKINGKWEPLGNGINYAVMLDTNKKHSDGTPVRQVKWHSCIISIIRELIA